MRREPRPSCAVQATHTMPKYLQLWLFQPHVLSFRLKSSLNQCQSVTHQVLAFYLLFMETASLVVACGIGCYSGNAGSGVTLRASGAAVSAKGPMSGWRRGRRR